MGCIIPLLSLVVTPLITSPDFELFIFFIHFLHYIYLYFRTKVVMQVDGQSFRGSFTSAPVYSLNTNPKSRIVFGFSEDGEGINGNIQVPQYNPPCSNR